ncbi:MAG: M18 family aminopeptidase [Acidimicrobiales bacterium]
MAGPSLAHAHSLCRFIDGAPSPYHVVESGRTVLLDAGFSDVSGAEHPSGPGKYLICRDGSLMAWAIPDGAQPATPFRIVGAHTDSPNLRLKPQPEIDSYGYRRLGVEVYGGVLLNTWLDRDLGLSGRVTVRSEGGSAETRLVHIDAPILRIPQLAIHLDREVSNTGLLLNKQQHLNPIYGLTEGGGSIWDAVANAADASRDEIVGSELMLHDTVPCQVIGLDDELISAPRLDNQLSCHAAITALSGTNPSDTIPVITLFDHEEVGSVSAAGAATASLPRLLERITTGLGGDSAAHHTALDGATFVSADNAHATHPNYPERHDPAHSIEMNGGPVLKHNANQRYTTDAVTAGIFRLAAERAGVATQDFVSRSDLPCGSTIGPTVSALLGVRAFDVGCPQLAMHSAREVAGSHDPWDLTLLLAELLAHGDHS